jgi:hypothetical protein
MIGGHPSPFHFVELYTKTLKAQELEKHHHRMAFNLTSIQLQLVSSQLIDRDNVY